MSLSIWRNWASTKSTTSVRSQQHEQHCVEQWRERGGNWYEHLEECFPKCFDHVAHQIEVGTWADSQLMIIRMAISWSQSQDFYAVVREGRVQTLSFRMTVLADDLLKLYFVIFQGAQTRCAADQSSLQWWPRGKTLAVLSQLVVFFHVFHVSYRSLTS